MSKVRGGWKQVQQCVEEALRLRGYVRPRDFEQHMNSHNWIHERQFGLTEVAPHIWVPKNRTVAITALAAACVGKAVVGLESALWAMRVLREEPSPVQLVVPRGSRGSRRQEPPMEFHWSDSPDEDTRELAITGIQVRIHSPARALVDIIRIREPARWPNVREDLGWAASLELFSVPELLALGSRLRALKPVAAWLEAQQLALPTEQRSEAGAPAALSPEASLDA